MGHVGESNGRYRIAQIDNSLPKKLRLQIYVDLVKIVIHQGVVRILLQKILENQTLSLPSETFLGTSCLIIVRFSKFKIAVVQENVVYQLI